MSLQRPLRLALFCMGTLGGSTEVAVMLAHQLTARGHVCDLYAYSDSYQHRLACDDIDVITPRSLNYPLFTTVSTDFGFLPAFDERHAAARYDLIHVHYAVPLIHIASNLSLIHRLPCILTFHGSDASIIPDQVDLDFIGRMVEMAGMEVTAASRFLAGEVHRRFNIPLDRIRIIANSVSDEFRDTFPAPDPADPYFVHCSNFRGLKRSGDVLEAMTHLRRLHAAGTLPRMPRLLFIGEGPDIPMLHAHTREWALEDVVEFTGRLDCRYKLAAVMAGARGVIMASQMESQPLTMLEAMALGTPVISSDFPSAFELLGAHGERGFIYPIGDVPALAAQLAEVLRDPARAAGVAARAQTYFLKAHDPALVLRTYEALYEASCASGVRG